MKTVAEILYEFNARISGDNTVDVYALFRDISSAINRPGGRALLGKPLQWSAVMLDRWHKEFRKGVSDSATTLYDTLQRVSILMESDLWAFETRNEATFKQTLFLNHRHLLEQPSTDPKTRAAQSALLTVSMPYLDPSQYTSLLK